MKKILQVVCGYFPRIGGIEQVAKDISDALKGEQYEMKVICFNETAEAEGMSTKRNETTHDTVDGVEIIRCGCIAKIASQLISPKYMSELKKVMNSYKPDIIILHYPNPFLAQFLLSYKKRPFKLVIYWHLDIIKQKILGKFFHFQNIQLLKRADAVVPTSPNYIEGSKYLSMYRDKCTVIPNTINPKHTVVNEKSAEKISKIKSVNDGKTICFALGRHVPYKGIGYLVKAAKKLDDSFKIYIGGSGPLTDELKEEAKDCTNIEFLGRVSDDDLMAYYNACDIFCFPSITKNEAFGIALAEGMYFGKPAVTFTIPGSGVNYVSLDGVTGIECPNCDVDAYAEALKKLADDKELCEEYGKNAKKRIEENFMFDCFRRNLLELLNELAGEEQDGNE